MAASPLTNLCSTCRRFADVLQFDILASSNAIFSYSGLEIEFEHGRPAGAATPPHRLCQRGGGSPRAILFIVHSMCPKCLLIAPFHNWSQVFKHAKRLGYGEHDVSAVYIRLLHLQTWQLVNYTLCRARFWESTRGKETYQLPEWKPEHLKSLEKNCHITSDLVWDIIKIWANKPLCWNFHLESEQPSEELAQVFDSSRIK